MESTGDNIALSAYLDGELDDAERRALEARLASDASLRAELDMLRGAVDFLQTHGSAKAPHDFAASVFAALADEDIAPASWWTWLRRPFGIPVEAYAVAATVMVIALVGLNQQPEPMANSSQPVSVGDAAPAAAVLPDLTTNTADVEQAMNTDVEQKSNDVPKELGQNLANKPLDGLDEDPGSALSTRSTNTEKVKLPTPSSKTAPEPTTSGSAYHQVPYRYTVRTDDPDVLLRLRKLAGKHEGSVAAATGPVNELTAGLNSLFVEVPAGQLNGLERDLAGLGSVVRNDEETPSLFPADAARVQVDVILNSQGEGGDDVGNTAIMRKQRALDAESSDEALHYK
jgi:negative regulator of sigma E activity